MNDTGLKFGASVGAAMLALSVLVRGCGDVPPLPPVPPAPVDPTPVDPIPVDPQPPQPAQAYLVLVIHESRTRSELPPSQRLIFESLGFREWLDQQGAAYRFWDRDDDLTHAPAEFRALAEAARPESLPWLIVTGRSPGYAGPLPQTVDAAKELIGGLKP